MKPIFTLLQLKQIIETATRVTDKIESLIDLVFTYLPFYITINDVYALSFSDLDLIGFIRKQNRVSTAPKTICCRSNRRYDHNKLKDDLKNTDWSSLYISNSILDSLQEFNRILTELSDSHILFAIKRRNTNVSPRLTVNLKKRNELQGCATTKIPQVENNGKLREMQTSEKQS